MSRPALDSHPHGLRRLRLMQPKVALAARRFRFGLTVAVFLCCAALIIAVGACTGSDRPRLTVGAAADLQFAFEEMAVAFEQECECKVVLTFGSSGQFATQIEQGLPVDAFFSANVSYVDDLINGGSIVPESEKLYGIGRIVLAVPASSPLEPGGLDLLLDPAVARIAIANPEHAPYGVAAQEALQSAEIWDEVQPKLVLGENASQTAQFVETGDADAGIIPLSLAVQREGTFRYTLIDEALHNPLGQGAGILSRSNDQELAAQFIAFVNGPAGRPIMNRYGFVLPGEAPREEVP
jgi:molybdate transport system substrate-binding protein